MIESLTYTPGPDSKFPYAEKLDYFKATPTTVFKPGLNIVFGANGSGKSTLLRMLGLTLAAVQGGVSTVTQDWLREVLTFRREHIALPCSVVHDGQPVVYHDAREVVGLIGGGAFDDDFFEEGLRACVTKGSVGQLSMARGNRAFSILTKSLKGEAETGFPKAVAWQVSRQHLATPLLALLDGLLEARCPRGPQTLLLDEPESGFGMPWQAGLWANILGRVDPARHQVIVATHSPFALEVPGAHYIEMTPGYHDECLATLMASLSMKLPKFFAKGSQ